MSFLVLSLFCIFGLNCYDINIFSLPEDQDIIRIPQYRRIVREYQEDSNNIRKEYTPEEILTMIAALADGLNWEKDYELSIQCFRNFVSLRYRLETAWTNLEDIRPQEEYGTISVRRYPSSV